jgi:hypothetical protein
MAEWRGSVSNSADPARVTHAEFVEAYRISAIRVDIEPRAAARFVSSRLLLPLFMLPVLGIGTALALTGWLWSGIAIIAAATLAPMLIKRSAPHFVLTQSLEDEQFYADALPILSITVPDESDK